MRYEPANTIIKELGGLTSVSKLVGRSFHSVMRWRMPKEKGGTGGTIPSRHIPALMREVREKNLPISAEYFISEPFPAVEEGAASKS